MRNALAIAIGFTLMIALLGTMAALSIGVPLSLMDEANEFNRRDTAK